MPRNKAIAVNKPNNELLKQIEDFAYIKTAKTSFRSIAIVCPFENLKYMIRGNKYK